IKRFELARPKAGSVLELDTAEHEGGADPYAPVEDIRAALRVIPNDKDRSGWVSVGMAAYRATKGAGFDAFDEWSRKWSGYDESNTRMLWQGFVKTPPRRIGAGTIFQMASKADPWRRAGAREGRAPDTRQHVDERGEGGDPFTEDALALRFSKKHKDDLPYIALKGQWLKWDGDRWLPEATLLAFDLARDSCREDAAHYSNGKPPPGISSAKTVAAVERLAKADRRQAATLEQWDADDWVTNTEMPPLDLHTAIDRPPHPPPH